MALGHPFTDTAIQYCGSVEFGGFSTSRKIIDPGLVGTTGVQFNFVVTVKKTTHEGETISFELAPIFINEAGQFNERAAKSGLIKNNDA